MGLNAVRFSLDRRNTVWWLGSQVLLTGLISFGTAFAIISYVVLKLNGHSWDFQCCMLFSITLCIIDPLHSVNTLKTIGIPGPSPRFEDGGYAISSGLDSSCLVCWFSRVGLSALFSQGVSDSEYAGIEPCHSEVMWGGEGILGLYIQIKNREKKTQFPL